MRSSHVFLKDAGFREGHIPEGAFGEQLKIKFVGETQWHPFHRLEDPLYETRYGPCVIETAHESHIYTLNIPGHYENGKQIRQFCPGVTKSEEEHG